MQKNRDVSSHLPEHEILKKSFQRLDKYSTYKNCFSTIFYLLSSINICLFTLSNFAAFTKQLIIDLTVILSISKDLRKQILKSF